MRSGHCVRVEKSVTSRVSIRHPSARTFGNSLSFPCSLPGCPLPQGACFLLVPSACTLLLHKQAELVHVHWLCAMAVSATLVRATAPQVAHGLQPPWEQTLRIWPSCPGSARASAADEVPTADVPMYRCLPCSPTYSWVCLEAELVSEEPAVTMGRGHCSRWNSLPAPLLSRGNGSKCI